jgi:hypothetical protein
MNSIQLKIANEIIKELIDCDVDGETMQYIIEQVGMENQMLLQLITCASALDLNNCLETREEIANRDNL